MPALVTGRLTGRLPGKRLALAAAGRVVAVTVPYRDEDVERFAALVPPQALAQAGGRLELFVVEGSGPSRHLVALRGASTGFRLVKRGGREAIVDSAGHETPVGPGIEGFIEALAVGDVDVTIKGWAGDTAEPRPADRVIAFSGSRLLGSGRPYVKRPDLKKAVRPAHGPGRLRAERLGPRDPSPVRRRPP